MTEKQDLPRYADVAIPTSGATHGKSVYTYSIPAPLRGTVGRGHLVWIPLRKRTEVGLVSRVHDETPDFTLRPLTAIVQPEFQLDERQMETAEWLAHETVSSLHAAGSLFFPPGVTHRSVEIFELIDPESMPDDELTAAQRLLFDLLREVGPVTAEELRRLTGVNPQRTLNQLEIIGLLNRSVEVIDRAPEARKTQFVRLVAFDPEKVDRAPRQAAILDTLTQRERLLGDEESEFLVADVLEISGSDRAALNALEKKGLVEIYTQAERPKRARNGTGKIPVLTSAQSDAWNVIERALGEDRSRTILLEGVTGSGKTELYLRTAATALRNEQTVIVLVPEIALATQMVKRFEERFPGEVAVLHSELTAAERYSTWSEIRRGQKRIVVGPRSALFAPVTDLAAIILDEEQDPAFKQESDPRYHARKVAEFLADQAGAVVLLGSATPSIETSYRARSGAIGHVWLPDRVGFSPGGVDTAKRHSNPAMPEVTIVDMRREARETGETLLSLPLQRLMKTTLERGEQSIVLLNRRGMSTVVICRDCGEALKCDQCDIPLVYHFDRDRLICHRCNSRLAPIRICPTCGGQLDYFGAGTQRIEQEVRHVLPGAKVLRLDRDSIKRLGGYEQALERIESGEADVVVGTQLVAKGLDFPNVTAIGVIQADSMLHLPDFRSAERTHHLVSQVAGRAGRRAARGNVIVQTYTPEHYAIQTAARHDFAAFYDEEIRFRKRFRYPPYTRLIRFSYRNPSEDVCIEESEAMAEQLSEHLQARGIAGDLLGPAPAFVAKIRGDYQWQIVVRATPDDVGLILDGLPVRPGWVVDVDPMNLL